MTGRINIAIAGGPCTGKSVLAAQLFASQKIEGYDFDLIGEECRKLRTEFGDYRSPFERIYMWRQQQREEDRSNAADGFITDTPLFSFYVSARRYAQEPRDNLAVRELFRMCLEQAGRYQLIVIAKNPDEILYKKDGCRSAGEEARRIKHGLTRSFIEHFHPDILLFVEGSLEQRLGQVETRIQQLRGLQV